MKKRFLTLLSGFCVMLTACANNMSDVQDRYFNNLALAKEKSESCQKENMEGRFYRGNQIEIHILESKMTADEAMQFRKKNDLKLDCLYAEKAVDYAKFLELDNTKEQQALLDKVMQSDNLVIEKAAQFKKQYRTLSLQALAQRYTDHFYEKQCAITPIEREFNFNNYIDCQAMRRLIIERLPDEMAKMRSKTLQELMQAEGDACYFSKKSEMIRLKGIQVFTPTCFALGEAVREKVEKESLRTLWNIIKETNPQFNNEKLNGNTYAVTVSVHDPRAIYLANSYLLDYKKFKAAYLKCEKEMKEKVETAKEKVYVNELIEEISEECSYLNDLFIKIGFQKITDFGYDVEKIKELKAEMR